MGRWRDDDCVQLCKYGLCYQHNRNMIKDRCEYSICKIFSIAWNYSIPLFPFVGLQRFQRFPVYSFRTSVRLIWELNYAVLWCSVMNTIQHHHFDTFFIIPLLYGFMMSLFRMLSLLTSGREVRMQNMVYFVNGNWWIPLGITEWQCHHYKEKHFYDEAKN